MKKDYCRRSQRWRQQQRRPGNGDCRWWLRRVVGEGTRKRQRDRSAQGSQRRVRTEKATGITAGVVDEEKQEKASRGCRSNGRVQGEEAPSPASDAVPSGCSTESLPKTSSSTRCYSGCNEAFLLLN